MIIDQQASSQKHDGVSAPASRTLFRHGAQRVAFSSRKLVPRAHQGPGRSARTAFSLVGKRWPQVQVRSGVISCTSEKQALQRRVGGRRSRVSSGYRDTAVWAPIWKPARTLLLVSPCRRRTGIAHPGCTFSLTVMTRGNTPHHESHDRFPLLLALLPPGETGVS